MWLQMVFAHSKIIQTGSVENYNVIGQWKFDQCYYMFIRPSNWFKQMI